MEKSEFKIDFIGIGAVRSGTTWLTDCLREHPQIFIPAVKEICFFNSQQYGRNYLKGVGWYQRFFKHVPQGGVKGEFTTHYMFFPDSAQLIKKHFPNVKIIACLRQPESTAYSFYWWRKSTFAVNEIPETFEDAFRQDETYFEVWQYYKQLKRYYGSFSKENIKIILFEDIKKDPRAVLEDLYRFLGVREDYIPSVLNERINKGGGARSKLLARALSVVVGVLKKLRINTEVRALVSSGLSSWIYLKLTTRVFNYPPMQEGTRLRLRKLFREDVEKLERLIGRDLSLWRDRP